jgi:serine protease
LFVTVRATIGHGPWLLGLQSADPPVVPKAGAGGASTLGAVTAESPDAVVPASRAAAADEKSRERACADEHLLVRLKDGVDAAAWAAERGLTLGTRTGSGTWRVRFPPPTDVDGETKAKRAAGNLSGDASVAWAEPDWVMAPLGTASDADFARQWNLAAIGAHHAWDATVGSSSVVVGVVDTGVVDHPDLQGQLVAGYDFISEPGVSLDGDGPDPNPTDRGDGALASGLSSWHGTHVAAIVVGRADAGGVVGVAPGCRVMPLRVLGEGGGLSSDVADAILFAAGLFSTPDGRRLLTPLKVVNLSLGSHTPSAEIEAACAAAAAEGVLLVAAAGNDAGDISFPAAFPTVMAVGAVDGLLEGTSYSSHGPQLSVCAPGGTSLKDLQGDGWTDSILSAVVDQTRYPAVKASGFLQGTSQAAPHVAGTAALLLSIDPTLTRAQLRQRIEESALDRGVPGYDPLQGYGLVQAQAAVKRLRQDLGQTLGPPALHLPVPTVRFAGFEVLHTLPLGNAGGGTLQLAGCQVTTDDGGSWLTATLLPGLPGADCNMKSVELVVDRFALPITPGWWSGTVRLYSPTEALGLVRVTVSVNTWSRAGQPFRVIALEQSTGGVRADGTAHPQNDYRYWLRGLPPLTYVVKSGDDLDADGFFCDTGDLCGWHGGHFEMQAIPLVLLPATAFTGIDVKVE